MFIIIGIILVIASLIGFVMWAYAFQRCRTFAKDMLTCILSDDPDATSYAFHNISFVLHMGGPKEFKALSMKVLIASCGLFIAGIFICKI
jgi:hypothetical protein